MARMKRVGARNRQIYTQINTHYSKPSQQHAGDTNTMPAFGVGRALRIVNIISMGVNGAPKRKVLKNGTRRIIYK
jgi:hypothetical protein